MNFISSKIISVACSIFLLSGAALVWATDQPLTGDALTKQMVAEKEACVKTMASKRKEMKQELTVEFTHFSQDMCGCALDKLTDFVAKDDSASLAFESATNAAVVSCIRGKLVNQTASEIANKKDDTEVAIEERCLNYLTDNTNPPDGAKIFWKGYCSCAAPKILSTIQNSSVSPDKIKEIVNGCSKDS